MGETSTTPVGRQLPGSLPSLRERDCFPVTSTVGQGLGDAPPSRRPAARFAEPCCVVSFASTHDAMRAELACTRAGVPGRIIPTPVQIHADCGLAWKMPPCARPAFEAAVAGAVTPAGYFELML